MAAGVTGTAAGLLCASHARTGAERLVDGLISWGIDTIFGMPGDGINGVMKAIRRRPKKALDAGTPGAARIRTALSHQPYARQLEP